MKPRAFRLLGESQLARVAAASGEAFARWSGAWFGPGLECAVEARPAANAGPARLADAQLHVRAAGGGSWAAVVAGAGAYRAAARRFASQAGETWAAGGELPPVLRGAAEECFAALAGEIVGAAGAERPARDVEAELDAAYRHASGAAAASATLDGEPILALLGPELVSTLCGVARPRARGGLAPRMDCIQDARLELRAVAGGAELGIGALLSIAPGDVIVLDARIDQTFPLAGPGGAALGRGFLGSSDGSKALQLVP
jgi:flagellar motor switch protein FliM/N